MHPLEIYQRIKIKTFFFTFSNDVTQYDQRTKSSSSTFLSFILSHQTKSSFPQNPQKTRKKIQNDLPESRVVQFHIMKPLSFKIQKRMKKRRKRGPKGLSKRFKNTLYRGFRRGLCKQIIQSDFVVQSPRARGPSRGFFYRLKRVEEGWNYWRVNWSK